MFDFNKFSIVMRDGASLSSHAPAAKDSGVATAKHVRAHICEVQLLLALTHSLKSIDALAKMRKEFNC